MRDALASEVQFSSPEKDCRDWAKGNSFNDNAPITPTLWRECSSFFTTTNTISSRRLSIQNSTVGKFSATLTRGSRRATMLSGSHPTLRRPKQSRREGVAVVFLRFQLRFELSVPKKIGDALGKIAFLKGRCRTGAFAYIDLKAGRHSSARRPAWAPHSKIAPFDAAFT